MGPASEVHTATSREFAAALAEAPGRRSGRAPKPEGGSPKERDGPDVAVLGWPPPPGAPARLRRTELPYVVHVLSRPSGLTRLWDDPRFLRAARGARGVFTHRPEEAERLAAELGMRGVGVVSPTSDGVDPVAARSRMGLAPLPHLAIVDPLEPSFPLELVALTHRRLAGCGLLVVGTGSGDPLAGAASASTRPSSPVLHVPSNAPEARHTAVGAAELVLALDEADPRPAAALALAHDRTAVVWAAAQAQLEALDPPPRLLPVDERTPEALRRALQRGLAASAAPTPSLPEALSACVSSS